jgi:hypothetical protein
MKYQTIEDYDGHAGATRKAGAAKCLARLCRRFDLLKRMRSDWSRR